MAVNDFRVCSEAVKGQKTFENHPIFVIFLNFDLCLTDSKPRRTVKKTIELTTIEQNKLPTGYCETCEDLQISRNQRKNNIKTVCEYHPLGELSFLCKKHTYRICKKHVDTNLQLHPTPTINGSSKATRRSIQLSEIAESSPGELREIASSKSVKKLVKIHLIFNY